MRDLSISSGVFRSIGVFRVALIVALIVAFFIVKQQGPFGFANHRFVEIRLQFKRRQGLNLRTQFPQFIQGNARLGMFPQQTLNLSALGGGCFAVEVSADQCIVGKMFHRRLVVRTFIRHSPNRNLRIDALAANFWNRSYLSYLSCSEYKGSKCSLSRARARWSRLRTVPTGRSRMREISS